MATPVIRETVGGATTGGATTVTTSSAVKAGDLLVAFHGVDYGTTAQVTTPTAGTWDQRTVDNRTSATNQHLKTWTRAVAVDGAQSVTAPSNSTGADTTLTLVVLDGTTINPASWLEAATGGGNGTGGTTTAHLAPAVTTTTTDALLLCAFAGGSVTPAHTYTTGPTGMTLLDTRASTYSRLSVYRQTLAAAGSTGTRTATASAARHYGSATIAIKGVTPPAPIDTTAPAIGALVDDFSGATLARATGERWGATYDGVPPNAPVQLTGGRARVTADPGPNYSGLQSLAVWRLSGSAVRVDVPKVLAVTAGSTGAVQTALIVDSAAQAAGTRLVIAHRAEAGNLEFRLESGYYEAAPTVLTYSATTHRWWGLRHANGNILFETSPDGVTWTTRRTLSSPSWVTATDQKLTLEAWRDNGASDYAEFDHVNTTTDGVLITGGLSFYPFFV